MDTVIVTGAAGLIGSAVLSALASENLEILAVVKAPLPTIKPHISQVFWHDLPQAVKGKQIKTLFHCAATHPTSNTVATPSNLASGNLELTQSLISHFAERQIERFIYLSTLSVYGPDVEGTLQEDGPLGTPDLYGQSKRDTELLLERSKVAEGTLILRLSGVLAAGNLKPLPGRWIQRLQQGFGIEISGANTPYNHGCLLDDIVGLCTYAHQRQLECFSIMNVASSEPIPVQQVAEMVMRATGSAPDRLVIREAASHRGAASVERLAHFLGQPPRSTTETLSTYLKWNGYSL